LTQHFVPILVTLRGTSVWCRCSENGFLIDALTHCDIPDDGSWCGAGQRRLTTTPMTGRAKLHHGGFRCPSRRCCGRRSCRDRRFIVSTVFLPHRNAAGPSVTSTHEVQKTRGKMRQVLHQRSPVLIWLSETAG
jgi:hypothetical protein